MSTELLLCLSQEDIIEPYTFKLTGVNIFSFEEAIYYIYHNWKEIYDDFLSSGFLQWSSNILKPVNLEYKIEEIKAVEDFSEKLIKFLSIIDYFDPIQIVALKSEVSFWETQIEWVRLKDRGNHLMEQNNPQLAYNYYKKALTYEKNEILYNNIGMAYMKMEMYGKAVASLKKAYEIDSKSRQIIINLAEALIHKGDFEEAFKYLKKAEKYNEDSDVYYLYAKLCIENDNIVNAIDYLNKAISLKEDNKYFYKLSQLYIKMRKFEDALTTLNRVKNKDIGFYINQANVYEAYKDYPAAIKCMEKTLVFGDGKKNIDVWVKLATYHRLNYEFEKADLAISKALSLDINNQAAKLEQAKIKKALGKTKEYKKNLYDTLEVFKEEYRNNNIED